MSDLKFKLNRHEYTAVFNRMKMINLDSYDRSLENRAKQEILQKIFMRMAQKMFSLKTQNNFTLSWSEAWAFFSEMPTAPFPGDYESLIVQDIINFIHQKTI